MAEQYHVAFLHDIFLAFEADLSFLPRGCKTSGSEEIIPANDFRANETLFDVAVNGSGGFDCGRALANRPGADFRLACGEKRSQTHQLVGRANQAVESRLF